MGFDSHHTVSPDIRNSSANLNRAGSRAHASGLWDAGWDRRWDNNSLARGWEVPCLRRGRIRL
jgi:hypothetical protein